MTAPSVRRVLGEPLSIVTSGVYETSEGVRISLDPTDMDGRTWLVQFPAAERAEPVLSLAAGVILVRERRGNGKRRRG